MSGKSEPESASKEIDARIREIGGWRGRTLARVRALIREAVPEVVEEVKWRKPSNAMAGVPVWSHEGILCTGETYRDKVKLTFAKGAALADPAKLFNSSLDGGTRRAIDLHEGDETDERAFITLVRAAAALNESRAGPPARAVEAKRSPAAKGTPRAAAKRTVRDAAAAKPKLLSGGNPQIPKADGDAPVQAYIAAMPGWKRDVGRRLDEIIVRAVPRVRKAVRWNSPFYGVEGRGWFLSYHCFDRYVKVVFLRGASLKPLPPVESKHPQTRYYHVHEGDKLDEELLTGWIRQAAEMPGEPLF